MFGGMQSIDSEFRGESVSMESAEISRLLRQYPTLKLTDDGKVGLQLNYCHFIESMYGIGLCTS